MTGSMLGDLLQECRRLVAALRRNVCRDCGAFVAPERLDDRTTVCPACGVITIDAEGGAVRRPAAALPPPKEQP